MQTPPGWRDSKSDTEEQEPHEKEPLLSPQLQVTPVAVEPQPFLSVDLQEVEAESGGSASSITAETPCGAVATTAQPPLRPGDTTPLPRLAAAVVAVSQLSNAVYITLPFTVLVFMVSDWFEGASEKEVAQRTGGLASLANLAGAVTSLHWGRYSDRNGRRPVLLIGNVAAGLSVLVLGLTRSYRTACISRLLGGALNGSLGTLKALISDVCDDSNTPYAFSLMSTGWGVGAVLGPAAGGLLSRPCAPGGLLGPAASLCLPGAPLHGRPYLLPCGFAAALCAVSGMLAHRLPETLRRREASADGAGDVELTEKRTDGGCLELRVAEMHRGAAPTPLADAIPWHQSMQVRLCLAGYALCAFIFIQVDELIPLFAAAPEASGGLELTPSGLAGPLAFGGAVVFAFTLLAYPRLVAAMGLRTATLAGFWATAAAILSVPVASLWPAGGGRQAVLYAALAARGAAAVTVFTSSMVMVNRSAPQSQLGEVNGAGQMLASFVRGLGPAMAGVEWGASVTSTRANAQFYAFGSVSLTSLLGLALYRRVDFGESATSELSERETLVAEGEAEAC